jgi:hypothetical protein
MKDKHDKVTVEIVGIETHSPELKKSDNAERQFIGGAIRDSNKGKGRFDLLPIYGLLAVAQQMERGALRYSDRNWEKGMLLSVFVDSALRHLMKVLAGFDDEPHMEAAAWNLLCLAEGRARIAAGIWPAEFDDLPKTYAGIDPKF